MKTIHSLNDLQQFGINLLTGESCALSRRLLCDVTKNGRELVCKALGIPDISLSRDWNGGDAVGSILLDRETLRTIAILGLFQDESVIEVWEEQPEYGGGLMGITQEDIDLYKRENYTLPNVRIYRIPNRTGRNVHQMSGRIN